MGRMGKVFIGLIIFLIMGGTVIIIAFNIFQQKYYNRVLYNGELRVDGSNIKNRFGEIIQLKGVSSHGIQWDYFNCITDRSLQYLRDEWKINVFRIAMYVDKDGYINDKDKIYDRATTLIDKCIESDIYVIIDWHITNGEELTKYKNESKEFFCNISEKYKDVPNLIYEICNEPTGCSWEDEIVPYTNEITQVIRNNSKNAIIIVGTPNYSRDILMATNRPINIHNLLYSYHFYANTHQETERKFVQYAYENNIPIIVSEWGTCDYTGDGEINYKESENWINFLNDRNISWINWSYSYKDEASAILKKEIEDHFSDNIDNYLTDSGKYVKKKLKENIK